MEKKNIIYLQYEYIFVCTELWNELSIKWPRSYWDDWMREPAQRKNRACIRPEISRTKTFGKIGVSNGLFFEKHLKYIYLNQKFVPFTVLDLSYLEKEKYDARFDNFFTGLKLSNSNKKIRGFIDFSLVDFEKSNFFKILTIQAKYI